MQIIIITYNSGKMIAMRKDDPALLDTLIADHDMIEDIQEAEFVGDTE